VKLVEGLQAEHQTHRRLTSGQWPYKPVGASPADRERLLLLTTVLGHDLCLPLLMAAAHLPEAEFAQVVSLTERAAFRYKIICNAHTTPLTNCYLAAGWWPFRTHGVCGVEAGRTPLRPPVWG
jgi:hypothetical protein